MPLPPPISMPTSLLKMSSAAAAASATASPPSQRPITAFGRVSKAQALLARKALSKGVGVDARPGVVPACPEHCSALPTSPSPPVTERAPATTRGSHDSARSAAGADAASSGPAANGSGKPAKRKRTAAAAASHRDHGPVDAGAAAGAAVPPAPMHRDEEDSVAYTHKQRLPSTSLSSPAHNVSKTGRLEEGPSETEAASLSSEQGGADEAEGEGEVEREIEEQEQPLLKRRRTAGETTTDAAVAASSRVAPSLDASLSPSFTTNAAITSGAAAAKATAAAPTTAIPQPSIAATAGQVESSVTSAAAAPPRPSPGARGQSLLERVSLFFSSFPHGPPSRLNSAKAPAFPSFTTSCLFPSRIKLC